MARGLNKVMLIGRLGRDPEIRYLQNGTPVANFSIATSRNIKKDNNWEEETDWHRIVVWDKLADFANRFLKKGLLVYVEGQLRTREWEDKDGIKRYTTEVYARDLQILSPKQQGDSAQLGSQDIDIISPPYPDGPSDDDVPF